MRKISLLLIFCFCYFFSFGQGFEGIVKLKVKATMITTSTMSADGEIESEFTETEEVNQNIIFKIKGDKTHVSIKDTEGKMTLITDKSTYDIISIVEANGEKHASKMNFKKQIEAQKVEESNADMKVSKTGNSKMIGDYKCYEYTVEDDEGRGTAWATTDINLNLNEQVPMPSNGSTGFLAPIPGIEGFIMEMSGTDNTGNDFQWNTTVEETSIDDSVFEITDENTEQKISKQEQMIQIAEEYRQKMLEAVGDEEKLKQLTEEMKQKMQEIQKQ